MSVSIPDWMEVSDKKDHHGKLSALERFVYNNEPADVGLEGAHTAKEFRDGLQAALEEVLVAPRPVGWVWRARMTDGHSHYYTLSFLTGAEPTVAPDAVAGEWVAVYSTPPTDRVYDVLLVQVYTGGRR